MGVDIIFRIAGIGIVVAATVTILKQIGREDYGFIVTVFGSVIVFLMLVQYIADFFVDLRRVFNLW